jgi:hypothetical protein
MKKASIPIVLGLIGISIPFLIRTTLVSYPLQGVNSPYLTIYLYSLDILLFLIWGYLIFITKKLPFSYGNIVDKLWIILFSYIFLRGIFAEYPLISWVYGLRFYLGISIVWYISRLQNWAKALSFITQGFIIGMLGQTIIAITQSILQKNINLPLVVEPALSPLLAGISKTIINGDVFIRAYGTFPHPNILAFAALMALLIVYVTVFTRKQTSIVYGLILVFAGFIDHYLITSIQAFVIAILTGLYIGYGKSIQFPRWFTQLSIWALHIIILLTFSKVALILIILLDVIYLTMLRNSQLFHMEQFQNNMRSMGRIVLRVIVAGSLLITLIIPYAQIVATISKRIYYIEDAWQIITNNWFWGIGLGQYVVNLPDKGRELWQYEPVHNIFLLIWSEIGFVGMALLITIIILEYYARIYGYKR